MGDCWLDMLTMCGLPSTSPTSLPHYLVAVLTTTLSLGCQVIGVVAHIDAPDDMFVWLRFCGGFVLLTFLPKYLVLVNRWAELALLLGAKRSLSKP